MDNNDHIATNQDTPLKKPSNKKKVKILFLILTLALVTTGAYFVGYLHKSQQTTSTTTPVLDNSSQNQDTPTTEKTFHTVLATGRPFDTSLKVTTQLAVPTELQSIAISSNIHDPGFTDILANKFNDEMGRWQLGDPNSARDTIGDISLIHVGSDWLKETSTAAPDYTGTSALAAYKFTTPAEKSASISKLESNTAACAKDSAKGFVISGKLNVCYTPQLIRQAYGTYSPILQLTGYGVIDQQKYILVGYIGLDDDSKYSDVEADKKGDAFMAGDIPEETQKLITTYVNALKNTTIVSSSK